MINIIFGRENLTEEQKKQFVLDSRVWFRRYSKSFWFNDPIIKSLLLAVDGATVKQDDNIISHKGTYMSPEQLSTGCKTLCCIYYDTENKIFYGSAMGDNVLAFLTQIAEKRDVTIVLEHYAQFPIAAFEKGILRCGEKILKEEFDFDDNYTEWMVTTREDAYFEKLYNSGI